MGAAKDEKPITKSRKHGVVFSFSSGFGENVFRVILVVVRENISGLFFLFGFHEIPFLRRLDSHCFFGDRILIAPSATGFLLLVLASKTRVKGRNVVLQSDVAQCFSDDAAENGPCEARGWGNNSAICPTSFFAIYGLNEDGKPSTTSELDRFPSRKTICFP